MKNLLEQTGAGVVLVDGLGNDWTLISKHLKHSNWHYTIYGVNLYSVKYGFVEFSFNEDGFLEDDGGEIVICTLSKKEDVVNSSEKEDFVNPPAHYKMVGDIEAKHIVKEVLDRWDDNFDMTSYRGGCMKEAIQYILRAPLKNGEQDIKKAIWYLEEFLS